MMHHKDSRSSHPFRQQINTLTLTLLCYELAGVYLREPVKREPCSRQDILFRRFLSLLATDITSSREVQYYADKLHITPKYLTIITRQISGMSATDWITRSVILNAKALLGSTQLTVQKISARLNFPNPSFFGQYFLRHTGMTPKEFRRSQM
jgi:AraC-like DNA-binding protein